MLILNTSNVQNYVAKILPKIGKLQGWTVVGCEEITEETYVNYIFRVELKRGSKTQAVYLRQTRDHLKASSDRKLDPKRILVEAKVLNLLNKIQIGVVPEVLFLDRENNIAILTDIKQGCPLVVKELLAGRAHPETGDYFGKVLATFHGETLGIDPKLVFGSKTANDKAVVFHQGMRMDPALKMFPQATKTLLENSNEAEKCLVLGDLTSKNIFVDGRKIRFLDLERAFVGDPAFDLGYLFAHYLTEIRPDKINESRKFIANFMSSYKKVMSKKMNTAELQKFEDRTFRFLGVMILFRFHGIYFVTKIKRDIKFWDNEARKYLNGY